MRVFVLCNFIFFGLLFHASALTCRSDRGPKEEELKMVYMNCLKTQDGKNSSNSRDYSDDYSSREKRKHSKGSGLGRRENAFGGREESYGSRDDWLDRDWTRSRDQTQSRGDWSSRDDKMTSGTKQYRSESGSRDSMNNMRTGTNNMRNNMNSRDSRTGGGNPDYADNDYESDTHGYNNRPSSQQSRRMKRERSSGHRSQYNPNTSRSSSSGSGSGSGRDDSYRNNDKNSSENNSSRDSDHKACALHCFLEELEMTGDNGMPDRYLVTQVITKDVRNEDLRDFLQESIEECFQILYNENMQDKCDFSKNLMLCLSEKGRANCDDWKDDIKI